MGQTGSISVWRATKMNYILGFKYIITNILSYGNCAYPSESCQRREKGSRKNVEENQYRIQVTTKKEVRKSNTEASEIREDPGGCGGKEVKRVVLQEWGLHLGGVEFCWKNKELEQEGAMSVRREGCPKPERRPKSTWVGKPLLNWSHRDPDNAWLKSHFAIVNYGLS